MWTNMSYVWHCNVHWFPFQLFEIIVIVCAFVKGKETAEEEDEVAVGMDKGFMDEFFEQVCLFNSPNRSFFFLSRLLVANLIMLAHHQSSVINFFSGEHWYDFIAFWCSFCGPINRVFYYIWKPLYWLKNKALASLSTSEKQHWSAHLFISSPSSCARRILNTSLHSHSSLCT